VSFDFIYNTETFLVLKSIQRDIIKKSIDLHVKYRVILSGFDET